MKEVRRMDETKKYDLSTVKLYCRIDYDDDDALLELMYESCVQEMKELISTFDEEKKTARQTIIICCMIKDLYDNRDFYEKSPEQMKIAISSMLLKEVYKGV